MQWRSDGACLHVHHEESRDNRGTVLPLQGAKREVQPGQGEEPDRNHQRVPRSHPEQRVQPEDGGREAASVGVNRRRQPGVPVIRWRRLDGVLRGQPQPRGHGGGLWGGARLEVLAREELVERRLGRARVREDQARRVRREGVVRDRNGC